MAIRFDASLERASRTTNLPTANSFSMLGWFMIAVDRNAAGTFFNYGILSGSGNATSKTLETNTDGTTLLIWDGSTAVTGTNLTVGRWYHLAFTYNGTNTKAYIDGVLDITNNAGGGDPGTGIAIGNDATTDNEWLNGLAHGIKIWSAVLTPQEIQQEMQQIVPVRWASLNSWYPCEGNSTSMLQEGGRQFPGRIANVLTAAGTLTYEQGPAVPWQQVRARHTWDVPAAVSSAFIARRGLVFNQAVPRASSW